MNFWFYCDEDDPIEKPNEQIPFNVEPSKDRLAQHIGSNWNELIHQQAVADAYNTARNEMIKIIRQLNVQLLDDLFVLAKDVPLIQSKLLELGWQESYWN